MHVCMHVCVCMCVCASCMHECMCIVVRVCVCVYLGRGAAVRRHEVLVEDGVPAVRAGQGSLEVLEGGVLRADSLHVDIKVSDLEQERERTHQLMSRVAWLVDLSATHYTLKMTNLCFLLNFRFSNASPQALLIVWMPSALFLNSASSPAVYLCVHHSFTKANPQKCVTRCSHFSITDKLQTVTSS
jgi:hypothetical protein